VSEARTLIAGEGGSVLVAAATFPGIAALACEGLSAATEAPSGIAVYPTDALPDELGINRVVLVPSEPSTRIAIRTWASAREIEVEERTPDRLPVPDGVRTVSVSAPSTGSGKTATVRRVVRALRASGRSVAVARHPIADLLAWDRFATTVVRSPDDLVGPRPLAEREELAPVVGAGISVATGLDPESLLRTAAREAGGGVVVLDGGGAAVPWIDADIGIVVVDLLRPPDPRDEERIARAHAVVLAKADSADADITRETEARMREWNPAADIVLADLAVGVAPTGVLQDRAVVCVEDWSSLVLAKLSGGAGTVAARRFRCGMVDPRPFAVGAVRETLGAHEHIGPVIPSIGRTPTETADLAASVRATPGEVVLWASNADPRTVIPEEKRPVVRAYGELTEVAGVSLQTVLAPLLPGHAAP
jgi:predicted GTPase